MEFDWDERKRREVLEKRGVDLLQAARIFAGPIVAWVDDRDDYREVRENAIGMVGDECFVVAFTRRGEVIRLITAWKGGRRARSEYQAGLARRDRGDGGSG